MILDLWYLPFFLAFLCSIICLAFYFIGARRRQKIERPRGSAWYEGASLDPSYDLDQSFSGQVRTIEYWETEPGHPVNSVVGSLREFLCARGMPATLLLGLFSFFWGINGFLLMNFLGLFISRPFAVVWMASAGAFLVTLPCVRVACRILLKRLPFSKRYAVRAEELIGCKGGAIHKITLEGGMAQVYDEKGNLHLVPCRIEAQGKIIQEGDKVLIVGYDSNENLYLVKQSPFASN